MKRDTRRGNDQWRGCYTFQNIVREDSVCPDQKRVGGLKMGHTYFYYYEVDGSTETYDPSMPCTTACPYLPGQMVNTLSVPMERTLRNRSASTGSIRQEDFKTMDPEAKFSTPKPLPPLPSEDRSRKTASPSIPQHCSPSRPSAPGTSWKRLFERKTRARGSARGQEAKTDRPKRHLFRSVDNTVFPQTLGSDSAWTSTSTERQRTRDFSPESLHRFLREDSPSQPQSNATRRPLLAIPDALNSIEADETDDDDNFAASAVSESQSYFTRLSPPPFQRSTSDESIARTIIASPVQGPTQSPDATVITESRWSISVASGTAAPSISDEEPVALFDYNDEEDTEDNDEDGILHNLYSSSSPCRREVFTGYSLPRLPDEHKSLASPCQSLSNFGSGDLIPRGASEIPVSGSNLLGDHTDSGLDNFASELGWIMDVISNLSDN